MNTHTPGGGSPLGRYGANIKLGFSSLTPNSYLLLPHHITIPMSNKDFIEILDKLEKRILYNQHDLGEFGRVCKLEYIANFFEDARKSCAETRPAIITYAKIKFFGKNKLKASCKAESDIPPERIFKQLDMAIERMKSPNSLEQWSARYFEEKNKDTKHLCQANTSGN